MSRKNKPKQKPHETSLTEVFNLRKAQAIKDGLISPEASDAVFIKIKAAHRKQTPTDKVIAPNHDETTSRSNDYMFCLFVIYFTLLFCFPKPVIACTALLIFGFIVKHGLGQDEVKKPKKSKAIRAVLRIIRPVVSISVVAVALFTLFSYMPLSKKHESAISESNSYSAVEKLIYTHELYNFRFSVVTPDKESGELIRRVKILDKDTIEKSGLCNDKEQSQEVTRMCESYEWYVKALPLIETYQYEPECLLSLETINYKGFVYCARRSPSFKDPINTILD